MDATEYRKRGKEMVDYIADYLENIRTRRVFPDVKPGYMKHLLTDEAPFDGEPWDDIFADVERVVMPGVTHWQSPYMHAYFPALNSFPSLLGDMLADAINCLGFTWVCASLSFQASSPACTELESIVMDWLGKMIGLPEDFLHTRPDSKGGGVIQTTASEATFVSLLAGRTEAIRRYHTHYPDLDAAEINSRLVAYCSDQAHSSVEKAGLIGLVKMRYIESDAKMTLRGDKLVEAIRRDRDKGLIPFFLCATLGTTGACSFDNLKELGPICYQEEIWMHVDAAYAGTAFICPEYRVWLDGIEFAHSLAFNPSKWMMVHFDCTAMWVKNSESLHRTFNVDPLYLKHENSGLAIDYMHWQIALSKRFRSLKLWFVIRSFGIKGLQKHVRKGVRLATKFEGLVRADDRFELPADRHLGMVVFRLKGENQLTEKLLKKLNSSGKLHCVPASLKGVYVIRFTVTSLQTTDDDIERDWRIICVTWEDILRAELVEPSGVLMKAGVEKPSGRITVSEIKRRQPEFGTSLLLANSPMSPKIVNGSYVAIFDNHDILSEFAKKFRTLALETVKDSPAIRRRVRGMMMTGKQFSLDSRMDLVQSIVNTSTSSEGDPSTLIEADDSSCSETEGAAGSTSVADEVAVDRGVQTSPESNATDNVSVIRARSRSVENPPTYKGTKRPSSEKEPIEEVDDGTTSSSNSSSSSNEDEDEDDIEDGHDVTIIVPNSSSQCKKCGRAAATARP